MILQAWLTLPSCLASSSKPTLARMIFWSWVIVMVSIPGAGGRGAVPARGENPPRPPAPTSKPTTTVRLSALLHLKEPQKLPLVMIPKGFHRIRHYGLFANRNRAANVARSRELLGALPRVVELEQEQAATPDEPRVQPCTCPRCGARMIIIEVFTRGCEPRYRPAPAPMPIRIDTS